MTTTTTTQPRHTTARWLTAPFRAIRHLNEELTGAGAAIAGSNRFPQPGPLACRAEVGRVDPAYAAKGMLITV